MLIDFHTHCFPPAVAEKAIPKLAVTCNMTPYTDGTLADTQKKMRQWQVDRFLTLNIATAPKQQQNVNNFAALVDKTPGCRGLGSVHAKAPDLMTELSRIHALGLPGLKLHPDYQDVEMDDPALLPVYDFCAQQELFCVFHAGLDPVSPNRTRVTASKALWLHRQFPKLKLVLAHMGGLHCWDEVEELLIGTDIYFDTALITLMPPEQAVRIIRRHGAERILFGSDCPWGSPADTFRYLEKLPLTTGEQEQIFFQNAQALLQWHE